jgi:hypothetical protein
MEYSLQSDVYGYAPAVLRRERGGNNCYIFVSCGRAGSAPDNHIPQRPDLARRR